MKDIKKGPGYEAEHVECQVALLKQKAKLRLTKNDCVMQELAELEYASKIHYIFLSRFLNIKASIILDDDPRKGAYFGKVKKEWRFRYGLMTKRPKCLRY
jgi:hypothetical protein